MKVIRSWSLLRQVLLVDAISAGAMGLGLLLLADPLAALLKLPASLLSQAGIVLVPFAAFVSWLASRAQPAVWAVWAVIGINVLWVAESILLLFMDDIAPGVLGIVFVIGQAAVVALLAELEFIGLRREARQLAHG